MALKFFGQRTFNAQFFWSGLWGGTSHGSAPGPAYVVTMLNNQDSNKLYQANALSIGAVSVELGQAVVFPNIEMEAGYGINIGVDAQPKYYGIQCNPNSR